MTHTFRYMSRQTDKPYSSVQPSETDDDNDDDYDDDDDDDDDDEERILDHHQKDNCQIM